MSSTRSVTMLGIAFMPKAYRILRPTARNERTVSYNERMTVVGGTTKGESRPDPGVKHRRGMGKSRVEA